MLYKFTSHLVLLTTLVIQTTTMSMAMDAERPNYNPSTPHQTAQTEKQSRDEILDGLKKQVQMLNDHEDDYLEQFKDKLNPEVIRVITKNRQANGAILSSLESLETRKMTEDEVIQEFLFLRLSLINSTCENTRRFMEHLADEDREFDMVYGPTDPVLFDSLTGDQQLLATKAINKYQIFNRILIGVMKLTDLWKLSEPTKGLLSASISLHALIEGKTTDLGRPDQTFHLAKVSREDFRDWELMQELKASRRYNVPYPAFLKQPEAPKKAKDPNAFLIGTLAGVKKKKASKGGKQNTPSKPKGSKEKVKETNKQAQAKEPGKPSVGGAEAISANQVPVVLPSEEVKMTKLKEPEMAPAPLEKALEVVLPKAVEPNADETKPKKKIKTPAATKTTHPISVKPKPESEVTDDKRPRGAIHYNGSVNYERVDLPRKLETRREDIFNPRMLNTVTFNKFAKLWKHINGENSIRKTGGSHKELLDQHGRVIAGTYADGKETFGKNTIKYIRDALTQIGYGK